MSIALAVQRVHTDLRTKELIVKATFTGNYVAGGDTLNLTSMTNPNNIGSAFVGYPGNITDWEVEQAPAGYTAELVKGATLATWKLKIYSAPATDLAAAAYPAGILAAVAYLRFKGPKGQL